jgi:hypothetical protein
MELPTVIDDSETIKVLIAGLKIDGGSGSAALLPPPPHDTSTKINKKLKENL